MVPRAPGGGRPRVLPASGGGGPDGGVSRRGRAATRVRRTSHPRRQAGRGGAPHLRRRGEAGRSAGRTGPSRRLSRAVGVDSSSGLGSGAGVGVQWRGRAGSGPTEWPGATHDCHQRYHDAAGGTERLGCHCAARWRTRGRPRTLPLSTVELRRRRCQSTVGGAGRGPWRGDASAARSVAGKAESARAREVPSRPRRRAGRGRVDERGARDVGPLYRGPPRQTRTGQYCQQPRPGSHRRDVRPVTQPRRSQETAHRCPGSVDRPHWKPARWASLFPPLTPGVVSSLSGL